MATSEAHERTSRNAVAGYVLLGLLAVAAVAVLVAYLNRPPQMGSSEEVFHTVDALYTAVRNRDEKQLGACEQRLTAHREAGRLPADAADELAGISAKARAGSWDAAAERLYDFMRAQQREARAVPPKPPRKSGK